MSPASMMLALIAAALGLMESQFSRAFYAETASEKERASVVTRATTDLAEWLQRYGLGQYAQAFAENHIEYAVLPDLTEDDLEKLGITLGHRKKLLRAIDALRAAGQASDMKRFGYAFKFLGAKILGC